MMELCTTLIVASHFVGASYSSIVGVQPQLRDYYRQGPTFKCVSGTGEISWDRLNDEVCDCSDGSDEPGAFGMPKCRMCTEGTSACSNGAFYCENKGYRPRVLPSTFVNDGVCDCCDGSDEPQGCKNVCSALGLQATKALREQLRRYEKGASGRTDLLAVAAKRIQQWKAEEEHYVSQRETLIKKVEELNASRESLRQRKEDLEAKVKPVADPSQSNSTDQNNPSTPADNAQEAHREHSEEAGPDKVEQKVDEGSSKKAEEDPNAAAKRIAAQWTSDPGAAGVETGGTEAAKKPATSIDPTSKPAGNDDPSSGNNAGEEARPEGAKETRGGLLTKVAKSVGSVLSGGNTASKESAESSQAKPQEPTAEAKELAKVTADYEQAASAAASKQQELTDVEQKLADAQKYQAADYGPDTQFAYMQGECYDKILDKYTYRICPYGKSSQLEGGRATSLGSFEELVVLDGSAQMSFTKGPSRHLMVNMSCGERTEVLAVEEPSRCSYAATLTSPALCTPDVILGVKQEIADFFDTSRGHTSENGAPQEQL